MFPVGVRGGAEAKRMTDRVLFTNARVVGPDGVLDARAVLCERGRITALDPMAARYHGALIVDCGDDYLAPGTIDVHIHGADGAMVEEATPEAIATVARALPRYGTTGFLATFATSGLEVIRRGYRALRTLGEVSDGARIFGMHLEGPYLNPERAGAQSRADMRAPDADEADRLIADADGLVKLVTLAPELPDALEVVRLLRARGVIVSAGHTDATAEQTRAGIDAGLSHATHLFNGMRGLHHREPGAAGALLADDRVTCEVICDGHHLASEVVRLIRRTKPADRLVLITDAVAPMGGPDGETELFNVRCIVRDGTVRLAAGGNLAGSVLSLDAALRNLAAWLPEVPVPDLWRYAARNPADELGLTEYGRIAVGAVADVVRYTPDLHVRETYRGGVRIYAAAPAHA